MWWFFSLTLFPVFVNCLSTEKEHNKRGLQRKVARQLMQRGSTKHHRQNYCNCHLQFVIAKLRWMATKKFHRRRSCAKAYFWVRQINQHQLKKNSSSRSATYFLKHPMLILVYSTVLKNTLETYSTLFVLRIGAEMKSQKWKVELPHIFALLGLESGSYKPLTLFDVVNPINRCDLPIKTHYPQ